MLLTDVLINALPNLFNSGKYMLNYGFIIDIVGIEPDFVGTTTIMISYNKEFNGVVFSNENIDEEHDEDVRTLDGFDILEPIEDIFNDLVNA